MSSQTWHVIGYSWREGVMALQVRALEPDAPAQNLPLAGEFVFRKLDQRLCIGWIDFEHSGRQPCPDAKAVSHAQCDACQQREGFLPCMRCNGFSCPRLKPAVEASCRQDHYLYLACFGSHRIKVGTATQGRKALRLLDQGPLAAAYVARAPGPTIKQMEYTIGHFGYTEAVQRTEKRQLLTSGMPEIEARALVAAAFADVSARLPDIYRRHLLEAPEFFERPPVSVASRAFQSLEPLDPEIGAIHGGTILAANGSCLILDDGLGPLALDVGDLKAWVVEINPAGPRTRPVKQLNLF